MWEVLTHLTTVLMLLGRWGNLGKFLMPAWVFLLLFFTSIRTLPCKKTQDPKTNKFEFNLVWDNRKVKFHCLNHKSAVNIWFVYSVTPSQPCLITVTNCYFLSFFLTNSLASASPWLCFSCSGISHATCGPATVDITSRWGLAQRYGCCCFTE